jgi:hypothetical protein
MNALNRAFVVGLIVVGLIVCGAGLATAQADVLRHAQVVASSKADFDANVQLIPTFNAMLQKSPGLKQVFVGFDPAKNTFTSTSIWDKADSVAAVTGSPEWKETVAKLKSTALNIEVLEIQPELSSHK